MSLTSHPYLEPWLSPCPAHSDFLVTLLPTLLSQGFITCFSLAWKAGLFFSALVLAQSWQFWWPSLVIGPLGKGGKHPSGLFRIGFVPSWPSMTSPERRDLSGAFTLLVVMPGWVILGDVGLTSAGASEAACPVQLALSRRRQALTPGQRLILAVGFSEGNCTLHFPLVHIFWVPSGLAQSHLGKEEFLQPDWFNFAFFPNSYP